MSDEIIITILGCGSSGGVPRLGAGWGACDPVNPKNRRRRCSILIERQNAEGITRVLIDASPDMREQLLRRDVDRLDALVFTHAHADHLHGIDDIRPLVIHNRCALDLYADAETSARIMGSFRYIVEADKEGFYPAIGRLHRIEDGVPFTLSGPGGEITLLPLEVDHGPTKALGFRIGDFAYLPDVSFVPERAEKALAKLDCFVLDALRYQPHASHFSVEDALACLEKLGPMQAVLTNLHSDLDYETLAREVPDNITPAFDGMVLQFSA